MAQANELHILLEAYTAAGDEARDAARRTLMRALNKAVKEQLPESPAILAATIAQTDDYNTLVTLGRLYGQLRNAKLIGSPTFSVAICGSFTTQPLATFVQLHLFAGGIVADVRKGEFGAFRQDILDESSSLYQQPTDAVFIATTQRDLAHVPRLASDTSHTDAQIEAEFADWQQLWQAVHSRLGCQIIQNNFEQPTWPILDNFERQHPAGFGRFVDLMNRQFAEQTPAFVTIHDVDQLAASVGRRQWADPRVYHYGKLPCALDCLGEYARSVASLVLASRGKSRKCLVLDLDNTIWGGIIGDDGIGGIELGQGTPRSESFIAFQLYAKALAERGVILAVCSKNDLSAAQEPFTKHPEMVLKLDDIACFRANWDNKPNNLRAIAKMLNIGLDSLVFVDDNPAERSMVRQALPQVAVPEIPADPAGYIAALAKHRYFQTIALDVGDLQRTQQYRANEQRQQSLETAESPEEFLASINMVGRLAPIDEINLQRSAQLINKTNQFNMTARRYAVGEVMEITNSCEWVTLTASLVDRFGDNGLISVLLGRIDGDAIEIDTWVMSCRVFKRTVEQYMINRLIELACEKGVKHVIGRYVPTDRNKLVATLYKDLGFEQVGSEANGQTTWQLNLSADITQLQTFIQDA